MAYSGLLLIFKVIFTFLLMVYFKLYYCKYCFSPEWTLCVASCKALPGFLQAEAIKDCASPVVCSRNCHSRTLPILLIMNLLALCSVLPQTSCLSFSRGLAAPVRLFSHGPTISVEDVCSASSFLGLSTSSQPRNMSAFQFESHISDIDEHMQFLCCITLWVRTCETQLLEIQTDKIPSTSGFPVNIKENSIQPAMQWSLLCLTWWD